MSRVVRRPDPAHEPPPGTHWEAAPDPGWRMITFPAGKRCRWGRSGCEAPPAAELCRGTTRPSWWAACADHLYGRWIEDGRVLGWRLVDDPPATTSGAVP